MALLRRMLVVRAAEEPDPGNVMLVRARESIDVIEFEVAGLRASVAAVISESAAPAISLVNGTLDCV